MGTESTRSNEFAAGAYAILGIDVVSFSKLDDESQIGVIRQLMQYVRRSVLFHDLSEKDFRWSPAGDGGYLTFIKPHASRAAIDVAFSIFEKVFGPVRGGLHEPFKIRAALHAGTVQEDPDFGQDTNIWGVGINTTARILSLSDENQLLVSQQYFDTYIRAQRESQYHFGQPYWRTVKHDLTVDVMNASKPGLCLDSDAAGAKRWRYLGGLWRKTIEEYEFLMFDSLQSGDSVAAIAAARYLIEMGEEQQARKLCKLLSDHDLSVAPPFPVQRHPVFSAMPAEVLFDVVRKIVPRVVSAGQVICEIGVVAESCFFPVSGQIVVDVPGREAAAAVRKGHILGEFSLWIANLRRTAQIRSLDPGLVLELGHGPLAKVLAQHPDVATLVHSIIKRRIVENVFLTPTLFPGMAGQVTENVSRSGAACEKYDAGYKLDLSCHAFVVLIGKLRIRCATGIHLDIVAEGRFDQLHVVGIESPIGKPDGSSAEVVEDTVAVKISHDALSEWQQQHPAMAREWLGLCGARLHDANWSLSHLPEPGSSS